MSYRSSLVLIPALSFVLSVSAIADITLNNGADIDMTGSPGSTIIFEDGTVLSTASGTGADGANGADGATGPAGPQGPTGSAGADGSDAAVPAGHGGTNNTVTGTDAFVGGGDTNTASGNNSAIPGGYDNTAAGDYSFAAGYSANDGGYNDVFIWGDSGGGTATGSNQFKDWKSVV